MTPETDTLAEYLRIDLERIVNSANEKLRAVSQAGLMDPVRRAEEARIINVARAFAVLRVESTVRHLRNEAIGFRGEYLGLDAAPETDTTQRIVLDETNSGTPRVSSPERDSQATPEAARPVEREPEGHRLHRILEFVARQEPGLRWAVGSREDGTTVLVTDLAYGWIPPGIVLPSGVELLAPARRGGNAAALMGSTVLSATYVPGDPFVGATEFDVIAPSEQPRQLPPVDDLGWKLGEATHWRDGLPRMVHTLAKAGAAGTGVVAAEIDVLRVHLDTARYRLLAQYPDVELALLLNCLLLAATERIATGHRMSANYHFAWFEVLSAGPASQWDERA